MNPFAKNSIALAAVAALAGLGANSLNAQQAPNPNDAFNLPEDVNFLGNSDPNMRRATARVNGNIITGTDVEDRVSWIAATNDGQIPPEEMDRLRLQVLRNLIDEMLQIQEAAALDMEVSSEEVEQAYRRFAVENNNMAPEEMDEYLRSIGSSPRSVKRQIQGELAFNNLLRRNVAPFVNVSTAEVSELFDRLQASRGDTEYRIGEIYLSANPSNRDSVRANAERIIEQLRSGGSFVAYARQYSEASTAAVGGDLGWIRLEQLQNPQLENIARDMVPGQLAGPIEIPGGYSILLLIDRQQVGMADPRDAILSLKQISIEFSEGIPDAEAEARAEEFAQAVQGMNGCGDANAKARQIGANVVDNDEIAVRALPEAFQEMMLQMSVGQATPPFGIASAGEGIRVLMLCGRDDPATQQGPNFDQLMNQVENERINRRAQRYLRDLRRDAVIEYN